MKCSKVTKRLLLFVDKELYEKERSAIQEHLNHCPNCSRSANALAEFYSPSENIETVNSPAFLWEKLYQKITDYENNRSPFTQFFETVPQYATAFAMVVIFFMAVLTGVYLGSNPDLQKSTTLAVTTEISAEEEFVKATYINSFDDVPSESVGGVYLTLKEE